MTARDDLERELKELIITSLALEDVRAQDIDSKSPLFGAGLGLDSIDALELVMALQRKYGFRATSAADFNRQTLASVDSLASFIEGRLSRA